jgi:hypothetical protein
MSRLRRIDPRPMVDVFLLGCYFSSLVAIGFAVVNRRTVAMWFAIFIAACNLAAFIAHRAETRR